MVPKFCFRSKLVLCQPKPSWFYEGGDLFSLCLFLLLGKQACIKTGLYKKGWHSYPLFCGHPLATPHVCGTQKGKCVPQGGGIFSVPQMALNQLHITKPPCRAPGPGYSCWDKFIHDCMGSCLIEAHYFHFLLTLCTPWGTAQASARGRGLSSCCCSHGSGRGWGITVPSPSTAA